ncbi:MAG: metal-dependent transcriptional regulator [Candidatus Freyarchaeota archaeon]|nr:metal-dependent transcriptional regulator [Candidatus Freyrarchaeum guaymaensis]
MELARLNVSSRAEDYLKGIHEIIRRKGYARIKDIANELNVKPSTAVDMVRRLARSGLVVYEKRGAVTLTPKGGEVAEAVKRRHDIFLKFLELIMVPRQIALKDAHILEHHLDPKTILQLSRFVDFLNERKASDLVNELVSQFKEYCKSKGVRL